ncbi:MAG: hypothetical protein V4497_08775 [Bacteroidota bacterium]
MKKIALLFVVLLGTSVLVTAAPVKSKTAAATEVTVTKKHKHTHKTRAERKEAKMNAAPKAK